MQNQQTENDKNMTEKKTVSAKVAQGDFVRQIVEKLKKSENTLIALPKNPTVDDISAAIALTMYLDESQRHVTAVYSGPFSETLGFLQPKDSFSVDTAGLQDFIISLDKDKADHLRYKLEGDLVRVYITPYKTNITEGDLSFSHGDYNVDFVVAIDVDAPTELDDALSDHNQIMRDASVVNITNKPEAKFGEIVWSNPAASSVSEMMAELIFALQGQDKTMNGVVATALLAGIVAATDRFSNDRTSSDTLSLASKLMSMGADQQLITSNISGNETASEVAAKIAAEEQAAAPAPSQEELSNLAVQHEEPVPETVIVAPEVSNKTMPIDLDTSKTVVQPIANPATQAAQGMQIPTGPKPAEFQIPGMPREMATSEPVMTARPNEGVAKAPVAAGTVPPMQGIKQSPASVSNPTTANAAAPGTVTPRMAEEAGLTSVARPTDMVLPPPPAPPTSGPEAMPPSLPPVMVQ